MNNKGLQKFTPKQEASKLLRQKVVTSTDLDKLSKRELTIFLAEATNKLNSLTGIERDEFIEWSNSFMAESTKNEIWEYNHERISWAISSFIGEYNRMPSKTEIAEKTGLSRQTIHKHLNSFSDHPVFNDHLMELRLLGERVLTSVFQSARNGNTAAAKLFLSIVGFKELHSSSQIQTQNNFIQINGVVISQEQLSGLAKEKLEVICRLISSKD